MFDCEATCYVILNWCFSLCGHQVQGDSEPDGHPDIQRRLLDVSEGCFYLAAVRPAGCPWGHFLTSCHHAGKIKTLKIQRMLLHRYNNHHRTTAAKLRTFFSGNQFCSGSLGLPDSTWGYYHYTILYQILVESRTLYHDDTIILCETLSKHWYCC